MPARIAAYHERLIHDQVREAAAPASADDPAALREVLTLLRMRTGHDFSNYKPATLRRRVERRMRLHGLPSIAEYAALLRETPDEAAALMKDLLISVTNFFRDPDAFDALERAGDSAAVRRQGAATTRCASGCAGCATGEEAYSLAMLLAECGRRVGAIAVIQVFATDLDRSGDRDRP